MTSFVTLLQQGNSWLFVPSAVLLGALHGLEPGHSKTMMAAFIVAIRGTLTQAVLLGLSATASHTAIVWAIALGGLYFGTHWNTETTEPYFQVVSAAMIIAVAVWMLWRTWRHALALPEADAHPHPHDHDHGHDHACTLTTRSAASKPDTASCGCRSSSTACRRDSACYRERPAAGRPTRCTSRPSAPTAAARSSPSAGTAGISSRSRRSPSRMNSSRACAWGG